MTITKMILMLACLVWTPLDTKEAKVTTLMSKDLTEFPGKEGVMITVEYPPGSTDPIHRHNAHAFIYVLEGSIVMQVRGGEEIQRVPGVGAPTKPRRTWRLLRLCPTGNPEVTLSRSSANS